MIKVKKQPITGANKKMRPAAPVKSGMNTSRDGERQIMQPPQPFANKRGPVNLPTSAQQDDAQAEVAKHPAGVKHKNVGHMALPSQADAGQKRPINHSGTVFGRFGTSHPKKAGSQNIGKSRKNARFYGE